MHDEHSTKQDTTIEDLLQPVPQYVPVADLEKAKDRAESLASTLAGQRSILEDFRGNVRAAFVALVDDGELDKGKANEVLKHLGLDLIETLFTVWVRHEGNDVLVVKGVKADDTEGAIDQVRDNVNAQASIESIRLTVEFEYNGEGEVDDSDTLDLTEVEDLDLCDIESGIESDLEYLAEEE